MLSRQNSTLAPLVVYFWGQSNCNEPAAYTGVLPFVLDTRICLYRHTGAMDRCGPTASGFHGMEIYLGTTLANATGRQVVIVKSSVDATSITTWLPGQTHDIDTQIPAAANAMRHPSDLDVQCVVLHGESDTAMSAATYQADLTILYARIRALLPGRGVRFHQLLLNVNDFQTGDPTTVRAGETATVAADGNAFLWNVDSITPGGAAGVHYTSDQWRDTVSPACATSILSRL